MNPKPSQGTKIWRGAAALLLSSAIGAASACGAEGAVIKDDPNRTPTPDAGPTPMPTATVPSAPTTPPTAPTTPPTTTSTPPTEPACSAPTCEVWSDPEPFVDPTVFPPCNDPAIPECIDGYCIPTAAVPAEAADAISLLQPCDDENVCIPAEFVRTNAKFIVKSCRSINDSEGRCLSLCIPQVASQASFLPQADCANGERCAPCYDPRTGEETGACGQGCDGGPCEPPVTFDKCCGGLGSCVPTSVVPEADQALLGTDSCTGTDQLCAPDVLASSTYVPPACRSLADAEGRCLAACIPQIADQASLLPQADCPTGELCAPCYDPIAGESTGACERNGDAPTEDPVLFDECCGGKGSCVPVDILSDDQKAQLGPDTCGSGGGGAGVDGGAAGTDGGASSSASLCAPKVFASPGLRATTCRSIDNAEGRCLPLCVPLVAEQADRLPQDVCEADEKCAPCYDPLTGDDTSACSQNGDSPTEPPYTFPVCCDGIGSCVPTSLVPVEQQSLLGVDTCTGSDVLCAPKALTDPGARPPKCYSFEPQHREGRCIAACVPQVAELAEQLLQETCATGELCAPCYDPRTGDSTGACEINGDAPEDPDPGPFPTCDSQNFLCFGDPCDGRCVPEYVAGDQATNLCHPPPAPCVTGEVCAPCYNPLDGTETGACAPGTGGACPP